MDEDLDDAPRFNTSIGFDELGRQIWYCTHDVIIVGMPCGPLESPEEKERNNQFGRDIGNNNNTTLPRWIDLPRSINDCKIVNGILECLDVEIIEEQELQNQTVAEEELPKPEGGGIVVVVVVVVQEQDKDNSRIKQQEQVKHQQREEYHAHKI